MVINIKFTNQNTPKYLNLTTYEKKCIYTNMCPFLFTAKINIPKLKACKMNSIGSKATAAVVFTSCCAKQDRTEQRGSLPG